MEMVDAAERLGVEYKTYSAYETGRIKPKPAMAVKIRKLFGADVAFGKPNQAGSNADVWKAIGVLEERIESLGEALRELQRQVQPQSLQEAQPR